MVSSGVVSGMAVVRRRAALGKEGGRWEARAAATWSTRALSSRGSRPARDDWTKEGVSKDGWAVWMAAARRVMEARLMKDLRGVGMWAGIRGGGPRRAEGAGVRSRGWRG